MQITTTTLMQMKQNNEKITALTAYDYPFAKMLDRAGIEMVLIGDSLGMVVQGENDTLGVTMDEMIYHSKMVAKACSFSLTVGDMPFMSYQLSIKKALKNAGRFLKQGNVSAVKLEGGADICPVINALTNAGIPVLAHIGLTPQSVNQMGGFRIQRNEEKLIKDAQDVQSAGAFAVILEGIPSKISKKITNKVKIPTIGIGAGKECDGQILVLHDMLGINDKNLPKFVKKYANFSKDSKKALLQYIKEVKQKDFPSKEHEYK